jgi:Protein of unknown function (DUF3579)
MHAATQQLRGTIAPSPLALHGHRLAKAAGGVTGLRAAPLPMIQHKPRQFFIQGITKAGKAFRPSDWAERLAGAMSSFRPGGHAGGIGAFIGYSPYCVPQVINEVKCVIVSEALRDVEPMAWDFVMNFARDNDLEVTEACLWPQA